MQVAAGYEEVEAAANLQQAINSLPGNGRSLQVYSIHIMAMRTTGVRDASQKSIMASKAYQFQVPVSWEGK